MLSPDVQSCHLSAFEAACWPCMIYTSMYKVLCKKGLFCKGLAGLTGADCTFAHMGAAYHTYEFMHLMDGVQLFYLACIQPQRSPKQLGLDSRSV